MASQGGGKIKSKGEHSPVKPYEQRKSFFQRVTDSIKDVLRPSWLAADPADVAVHPTGTSGKSATAAAFQEEGHIPNEELSSELLVPNNVIPEPPSFQHPDYSVTSGSTHNLQSTSSAGNSSGLWSVTSGDTSGFGRQTSPVSYNGPGQMVTGGRSSLFSGRTGAAGHLQNASQRRTADATRGPLQPSENRGRLTSLEYGQLSRSSAHHSFTNYRPHVSQSQSSSASMARQRQLRQRSSLSSHSFSGRPAPESAAAVTPSKRQRVWTPEMSRKGRSLQPAVRGQPAFSMSAFCSSSLNSPPVRRSVTPKPVNRSNSAVLSSSTTQIFKTLERLSDAKRARVNLQDSESLLSFTPPSYRQRSRPFQRDFQSYSLETQSPAQSPIVTSDSGSRHDAVSAPPAVALQAAPLTAPPLQQQAEDEVVIADESSDDDDVQIIESPEEATRKDNGPGNLHNTSSFEKCQQQSGRQNDKGSLFNMPAKATQGLGLSKAGSPATGGFGSAPFSVFATPPSWGSTAPKPKSIIAGNSKPVASNRKSVSFNDGKSEQSGGPVTPVAPFQSGSVMDILGKSPEASTSLKSAGQLKQGNTVSPSKTSVSSGGDSLFAKFTAASGSWECEACMLHNKPDATHCVACQASRPGAAQKASSPVSSGGDSLFAKFTAPSGSWECEACMLNNKPDAIRCVACQAGRPGAGASRAATSPAAINSSASSVSVAVGSSGGLVFTVPPSSTVSSPFLAPPSATKGSFGGVQLGSTSSSATPSVPASGGFKPTTGAEGFKFGGSSSSSPSPAFPTATVSETVSYSGSAGFTFGKPNPGSSSNTSPAASGFKFGASSSPSPAFPTTGGVKLGTAASGTVSSSGSAGFTFGKPSPGSSSNASPAASGFQFGAKGSSDCHGTKGTAAGFQFGASSAANSVSSKSTSSASLFSSPSFTASNNTCDSAGAVLGFTGKTVFGVPPAQCERANLKAKNDASKLTAPEVSHTDSRETKACKSAPPLSSVDKTCDGVSECVGPSLPAGAASSLTTGGVHFSSSPFVLGSTDATKVTLQGSDSCAKQNTDLKTSSLNSGFSFGGKDLKTSPSNSGFSFGGANVKTSPSNGGFSFGGAEQKTSPSNGGFSFGGAEQKTSPSNGGFSFGGAAKSEQSASPAASSNQNGPNLFASISPCSKGFVFGAPTPSLLNSSASFSGTAPKPDTGSRTAQSALNGEAGAVERCAFGGGASVTGSSSTSPGFSFGSPSFVPSKKATSGQNLFAAQAKQPSLFGAEAGSEGTSCEVVLVDDGPEEVKEPEPSLGSQASSGIASTTQASSGFGFGTQTNAASSKELPSSQGALLSGAGAGSTSTGQFSFSVGAGSQSNAAAASPLVSEVSAPVKGFSFSGATQPSFSFGSGSSSNNSNNSAPAFQFASPQSVDTAPAQSSSGTCSFGQAAPSAKSSDSAHAFAAPTPVAGLGTGPAQNSFSVGTGESPRKLKRAVRRVPKN